MKHRLTFLLTFLLLLFVVAASAQNVGIKVDPPTERLHVDSGNIKIGKSLWSSVDNDRFLLFGDANYIKIGETNMDDQLAFGARNFTFNGSSGPGFTYPGNVGIGNTSPTEKLEVTGSVKVSGTTTTQNMRIVSTSGAPGYHLKTGSDGNVAMTQGYGGLGIKYIIATCGIFPSQGSPCATYNTSIIGEIRMFAGNYAPSGWAFCDGQILPIAGNETIFSLLGTLYGGNGISTFALPDLRAAVPVHSGTAGGNTWNQGERSN